MKNKKIPTGIVKIIGVRNRRQENPVAVYANVVCEDEEGLKWEFAAASMNFDLVPHLSSTHPMIPVNHCASTWADALEARLDRAEEKGGACITLDAGEVKALIKALRDKEPL